MKLVMDERVKHRLIGLAVILSIAAIFAPAIMKKSNQRFNGNVSVSVQLPPKPAQPDINITEKKELFDSIKVAHVELPELKKEKPLTNLEKAQPIGLSKGESANTNVLAGETLALADEMLNSDSTVLEKPELNFSKEASDTIKPISKANAIQRVAKGLNFPAKPATKPKVIVNTTRGSKVNKTIKTPSKAPAKTEVRNHAKKLIKNGYVVQLATFSSLYNAVSLISRLKNKGYNATYNKVKTNEGMLYKVVIGPLRKREEAQHLQLQLANVVQIRGFIVQAGEG